MNIRKRFCVQSGTVAVILRKEYALKRHALAEVPEAGQCDSL